MRAIIVAATLAACAGTAAAEPCSELRFLPGESTGQLASQITDQQPQRFFFRTGIGQTPRIHLFGSDNTCFTLEGVVDSQDDDSFVSRQGADTFRVFRLFRRPHRETNTLRLSVSWGRALRAK